MQNDGTSLADEDQSTNCSAPGEQSEVDRGPEQEFNRKWGYLPPLDEEALALIDVIIADPDIVKMLGIRAESEDFVIGLEYRNVGMRESAAPDAYVDEIKLLTKSFLETEGEKESHGHLWTFDQAKCDMGSNEALFQRTLMMDLIMRHRFMYNEDTAHQRCLDFSVEEPWTCPSMPTQAFTFGKRFLTQPKPDLAVCFSRQALIPDTLWYRLPSATRRLACYENLNENTGSTRVFHFLTIEAKKAQNSIDNTVGRRQSLNNASQGLHNMFEFFRDAGPEHEDKFFSKVRFFSVVASTEGLAILIHRATRESEFELPFITVDGDYPLRFEHRKFSHIQENVNFDRKTVFETLENILCGYGVGVLGPLLHEAAEAIKEKLKDDRGGMVSRENNDFYRHG